LETSKERLQLVMRSEKVARMVEYDVPLMSWYGKIGTAKRRAVVYEYVFDEKQRLALREAGELARRSGLVLEVTDLTRQSALRRILRLGTRSRVTGRAWWPFGQEPATAVPR
jgi:hypothetical protein